MSAWDKFVQKTLLELRNGAPIPAYFGPLIALLRQEHSQSTVADFQEEEEPEIVAEDPEDELIQEEDADTEPIEEVPEEQPRQTKSQRVPEDESLWFNSTRNAKQPPPAIHDSDSSFEFVPQTNQRVETMESDSGPVEEPVIEEEEDNVEPEVSEIEEPEDSNKETGFSDYFRQIGDMVFGQYWYPLETVIPRMTLESKFMTTFKVTKYERLKGVMIDQTRKQLKASNQLMFRRRQDEEEDMDEYE